MQFLITLEVKSQRLQRSLVTRDSPKQEAFSQEETVHSAMHSHTAYYNRFTEFILGIEIMKLV